VVVAKRIRRVGEDDVVRLFDATGEISSGRPAHEGRSVETDRGDIALDDVARSAIRLDERDGARPPRQCFETDRACAGEQVEDACTLDIDEPREGVEQRLAGALGRRSGSFDGCCEPATSGDSPDDARNGSALLEVLGAIIVDECGDLRGQ